MCPLGALNDLLPSKIHVNSLGGSKLGHYVMNYVIVKYSILICLSQTKVTFFKPRHESSYSTQLENKDLPVLRRM